MGRSGEGDDRFEQPDQGLCAAGTLGLGRHRREKGREPDQRGETSDDGAPEAHVSYLERNTYVAAILKRPVATLTVSAHFDGKVIVPDEPLDLPPNQALILEIRPIADEHAPPAESALDWIAGNAVDSSSLPEDLADRHDHYLYGRSSGNEQG